MRTLLSSVLLLLLAVAGCSDDSPAEGCAHVIAVEHAASGDGTHRFTVTVRSADTGPERYADAWEIVGGDGTVLGRRDLLHHHADEQPFTRSLDGVDLPPDIGAVTVRAHDTLAGWCGDEIEVEVDR